MKTGEIKIRECTEIKEFYDCIDIQRKIFGSSELEISPVRHFIVAKNAGGFTLGAFVGEELAGFVLSNAGFRGAETFFYSHMTAVSSEFQNHGIGTLLKWAQRDAALKRGVKYIKWTFQPVQARNAFFNLEKLGATVREYQPNFYGTDYSAAQKIGLDSDRLFAEWYLKSEKVRKLAKKEEFFENGEVSQKIKIPNNWNDLVRTNPTKAIAEQTRIKNEFDAAFNKNLIAKSFVRSETDPYFLLYDEQ